MKVLRMLTSSAFKYPSSTIWDRMLMDSFTMRTEKTAVISAGNVAQRER
jgi:hypothetical protein